ncbi:uncharacterized protein LOC142336550 [Convolutriloba macropyga]|uniref:uncharacterized protein LOC142336550 n=1 Tax=Convolutriloba macropyga TaxID=536237 RepID=UPI003F528557
MTRVTYGIALSAFQSSSTTRFSGRCYGEKCTARNHDMYVDIYVDDLLTGAADLESAMNLQDSIIAVLSKAGIRKWISSNPKLAERLPANFRETTDEMTIKSDDYSIKTLGVKWNPNPDHFSFIAKLGKNTQSTKREIVSEVTRLFDSLGWLSPTTIQFKSFVQLLWMDRLGWDDALSKVLQQQYSRFRVQLRELENITLPRKVVSISPASPDVELYVFCDASTTAYAAVVYIRQSVDGSVHTRILTAENRVAPKRSLCVPRLELCAALSRKLEDIRCNCVAKIQNTIPSSNGNFVPTEENPADCATQAISAANLVFGGGGMDPTG